MSKKKKKLKKEKGHQPSATLTDLVTRTFTQHRNKPMNYKQLLAAMGLNKNDRKVLQKTLERMVHQDALRHNARGKYFLSDFHPDTTSGVLQMTRSGVGYVITGDEDDVLVEKKNLGHALDGDTVEIEITGGRAGKPNGRVVRVVQSANTTLVGIIEISEKFSFVAPSNPRIHVDVFVLRSGTKGAKNGQKVVVELTGWPEGAENPTGKVIEVLGNPGDHNVEMNAIMAEYGLPMEFPDRVVADAGKIPTEISSDEIKKRRDFRKITTFTIDPYDAKDFDDALSVEFLDDGITRVGIHIADVSHYVLPGSVLDQEAVKRATSVYLVDRVVPMLPEVLSNVVCSLRPEEEKLCFSAVFDLDEQARIKSEWFGKTVIRSDHRFTYENAQEVIDAGKGPYIDELNTLLRLSKIMRRERIAHGAIEFGGVEVKFELDEQGKPIGVKQKKLQDTNRLIEDFMLLANKRVAASIGKSDKKPVRPFVYRVHDEPDEDKLMDLKAFARRFGHEFKHTRDKGAAHALTSLLREIEGKPEESILRLMALRSMSKAYYSTKNIGHYGLSFDFYTHFTSPIRRYPDVLVHRVLEKALCQEKSLSADELELLCRHCSVQEKKATEAERSSIKYKQVEFMMQHVGEEFEGIISGLTNWGMFVEIVENACEGMVRLQDIPGDYYYFDEENYRVSGKRKQHTFEIGQRINVRVVRGDLMNKQLDFAWVPDEY